MVKVGDAKSDHDCWERPETMSEMRPLTQVNASFPGTDVAAETAAAMASASLVFKKINSTYSNQLLVHAQQLFMFADTYRGSYSISVPQVQEYYNSTGYGDELLWAASWLYYATGDNSYLNYVTELNGQEFANWGTPTWFSWDDKLPGVQVYIVHFNKIFLSSGYMLKCCCHFSSMFIILEQILLSRIILFGVKEVSETENLDLQMYRETAEAIMCGLLPDSPTATSSRTDSSIRKFWT